MQVSQASGVDAGVARTRASADAKSISFLALFFTTIVGFVPAPNFIGAGADAYAQPRNSSRQLNAEIQVMAIATRARARLDAITQDFETRFGALKERGFGLAGLQSQADIDTRLGLVRDAKSLLQSHFESVERVSQATRDEITRIEGLSAAERRQALEAFESGLQEYSVQRVTQLTFQMIGKVEEILILLQSNKSRWTIQPEGRIGFYDAALLEQFRTATTELESINAEFQNLGPSQGQSANQ